MFYVILSVLVYIISIALIVKSLTRSIREIERLNLRIRKLEEQVTESTALETYYLTSKQVPTLKGKVDAIEDHLGLKFTVKPAEGIKVAARKKR